MAKKLTKYDRISKYEAFTTLSAIRAKFGKMDEKTWEEFKLVFQFIHQQ